MKIQFLDRHKINTTARASSTSIPVSFHGEGEEEWSSSCGGVSMAGHGPPHTLLPSLQAHSSKGSLCFFHLHPKKHSQTSQNTLTPLFSHQPRFPPFAPVGQPPERRRIVHGRVVQQAAIAEKGIRFAGIAVDRFPRVLKVKA